MYFSINLEVNAFIFKCVFGLWVSVLVTYNSQVVVISRNASQRDST